MKGYDFLEDKRNFNAADAVVRLGVGKNMAASIRFWLRSFGVTDERDNPTAIGNYLFGKDSSDPFLEDNATLWLLHHSLITSGHASLYSLFFNEFRMERIEFTKEHLLQFVKRKSEEESVTLSHTTINTDIKVFVRTYLRPDTVDDLEEDYSSLLMDLELLKRSRQEGESKRLSDWYIVEGESRPSLPYELVLYSILQNPRFGDSVSFRDLLVAPNSPGLVFCLSRDGLFEKLEEIALNNRGITFSGTAGNFVLQFRNRPKWEKILDSYYASVLAIS